MTSGGWACNVCGGLLQPPNINKTNKLAIKEFFKLTSHPNLGNNLINH